LALSNIEIAQKAQLKDIREIAEVAGIRDDELECYGRNKAKVDLGVLRRLADKPDGRLVLVTAVTPTLTGEGKSTVTVGLGQALHAMGKRAMICLREPSLGPCFGMKGGACGGGYSQVVPMEDINLHFTGDIHAVTAAHNLLACLLDNHLHWGNDLGVDIRRITWTRVQDVCDRSLRDVLVGLGGANGGIPRETSFRITAASEVMAILCLAGGIEDLKSRLAKIIVGYTSDRAPVTAADLKATGGMALLLKDALKPNLVQTLEGSPAFVHGGPFANIAHGCNSVLATRTALKLADYVITEAGFGSDLGAEKFFNIKCRAAGLRPSAAVLACTLKAVKRSGGGDEKNPHAPDTHAIRAGVANVHAHIDNLRQHGVPVVVAVNRFGQDSDDELSLLCELVEAHGAPCEVTDGFAEGSRGAMRLAERVLELVDSSSANFHTLYPDEMGLTEKVETIATRVYGADGVDFLPAAARALSRLEELGLGRLPVCMAKTQYSLTDDPKIVGRPRGFRITVRDAYPSTGAGFVVCLTGEVMTMPAMSRTPAAIGMDIAEDGTITGLF